MNKTIPFLIFVSLIFSFSGLKAQDNQTVSTKVADILNEMPAKNTEQLNRVMSDINALSNEGFELIFKHLQSESSESNHQKARYALESYARYLSNGSPSSEVNRYHNLVFDKLGQNDDFETRDFLLSTLQYTINTAAIKKLGDLPEFPDHYDRILHLMEISGSQEAIAFLEKLYYESSMETLPSIINALTRMRSFGITNDLINQMNEFSLNEYPSFHRAGNYHLSHAVTLSAYEYFLNRAIEIQFDPIQDNTHLLQSFVNLLQNAYKGNKRDLSSRMFADAMDHFTHENQLVFRLQAITAQLKNEPKDPKNIKLIKTEIKNPNPAYRSALLDLAIESNLEIPPSYILKNYQNSDLAHRSKIMDYVLTKNDKGLFEKLKKKINPAESNPMDQIFYAELKFNGVEVVPSILEAMNLNKEIIPQGITALNRDLDRDLALTLNNNMVERVESDQLTPPYHPLVSEVLNMIIPKLENADYIHLEYYTNFPEEDVVRTAYNGMVKLSNQNDFNRFVGYIKSIDSKYHPIIIEGISKNINLLSTDEEKYQYYKQVIQQTNDLEVAFQVARRVGGLKILQDVLKYKRFDEYADKVNHALFNWTDKYAIPHLFDLLEENVERELCFNNILRLCQTGITADQKLLYLRDLMEFADNSQERGEILSALRTVKTYPAFKYVSPFLKDEQLEQITARVLTSIALPSPGDEQGLFGSDVRQTLIEVIAKLKGGEAPYIQEDIRVYLRDMPEGTGFSTMFNGENLDGWKGFVANPIVLNKMDSEEVRKKQMDANEALKKNWSVENGWIKFTGDGQNLVSVKEYGDFEMYVDWRISRRGDSGIYLRGTPQVQIWDTSRVESGAQVGSGGLYNNQNNPSKPLQVADNPINKWNTFHITMIGEEVTVYLNGKLVVDRVTLENYWDRSQHIFATGPIELQAHGTDLAFRDIYVREISSPDFSISATEKTEGFKSLFDGSTLNGWVGNKKDYRAESGIIIVDPQGGGRGNLYTEKEYDNFIFRFEFQLTPGANNGLGIHAPLEGDAAYVGKELQILDNTSPIYAELYDWQYHGSVYGIIAAKRGHLKPVGEWNEQEVIVDGNRIKITLNGEVIVDGDYVEASKNGTADGRDHPGIQRKSGHIGFLGHGSPLKFRNIRIKEL